MAQHKNLDILLNWNTTLFPAVQEKMTFERKKVIRTFKGINFQWLQEHLVHINVLEVNAFKGTVQAVCKRVSIYKMVPIYGKEGSAHSG